MKQDSDNAQIKLRDGSYIIIKKEKGLALMDYLIKSDIGSHVMITDINGKQVVLNKNIIDKVSMMNHSRSHHKTPSELGMPNLIEYSSETVDGAREHEIKLKKIEEAKKKFLERKNIIND